MPVNYIADNVHMLRNTQVHQNTNGYGKCVLELCNKSTQDIEQQDSCGYCWKSNIFFNHNGVSIDDYCICSSSFLSNIVNFQVEEFIPNLSDHCPITVNVLSQYSENISSSTLRPLPFNIKWTKDVENKFVSNLKINDFRGIF